MSTVTIGRVENTALRVLSAISLCHLLNDLVQSVIPAVYPILKNSYGLDFGQIGLITLTFQVTASILQPVIGTYTDAHPTPNSLPVGMAFTVCGTLLLAAAPSYAVILVAVALVGMGSAVFHPESSRVARVASGGRHGLAQSFFQVGGNAGSALGPLMAAFIVLRDGETLSDTEVIDYCRSALADFKRPRKVTFLPELPRNPTGKVLKRELREMA